ncbi:hypothetical protein OY671_011223, partial [Metschnikowia pulcherrima]
LEDYVPSNAPDCTRVFVNGVWVGTHREPAQLVDTMRRLRRKGDISPEVSIIRDIREMEFKIFTDAGRVYRPLFIVDDDPESETKGELMLQKEHVHKLLNSAYDEYDEDDSNAYTWSSLVNDGVVEYVDAEEEETIMIAMTPEDLEASKSALSETQQQDLQMEEQE